MRRRQGGRLRHPGTVLSRRGAPPEESPTVLLLRPLLRLLLPLLQLRLLPLLLRLLLLP